MNPVVLLYEAENEILVSIASLLARGNIASADWKLDRLQRIGGLTEHAAAIIRRYRDAIQAGTLSEIEHGAMDALLKSEAIFDKAKRAGATIASPLPIDADPTIRATIAVWQDSARDQMNLAMANLLQNCGQLYADTINRTTAGVLSGALTSREALVRSVREWSTQGIPSITDKSGRVWSTEAYAGMVIRSNVARVTNEAQQARAKEYGADLIEVSAHAGARPLCAPYQGKVFSLTGASKDYPSLASTSYGEPAGLFGVNCGHISYPFFPGISRQTYAPDETDEQKAENERVYAESQKQRHLERAIRSAKREARVFEALGDTDAMNQAKSLVRDRQAAMREFIDETGRTRRPSREQIYSD